MVIACCRLGKEPPPDRFKMLSVSGSWVQPPIEAEWVAGTDGTVLPTAAAAAGPAAPAAQAFLDAPGFALAAPFPTPPSSRAGSAGPVPVRLSRPTPPWRANIAWRPTPKQASATGTEAASSGEDGLESIVSVQTLETAINRGERSPALTQRCDPRATQCCLAAYWSLPRR